MKSIWLAVLLWLPPAAALAGKLPDLTLPDGVGVNIHFTTGHEKDLDLIAAAGFKFVRMDFLWAATERQKGVYDWSDYDAFTAELERHHLRAYYILDYSNPLYQQSVAPFARWAGAAAKHFRGRGVIWEIWNEPNGSFWPPKPDVTQYNALALATAKAVREADPQACLVAPACAGFDWNFLEGFFKSGALAYIDAVSMHPYRGGPPETAAADYARLRELIARYAPAGKTIPILSGEWGYSTCTRGVSLETQANYIARQQLSNLLNGVPLSIWYDWKNDGTDPAENEHNFGTVYPDLKPKPAYLAIQKLTDELTGYRIASRHNTGNPKDFVLVLTNRAGATKLAAWTAGRPHSVEFDARLKLELNGTPQYLAVSKDLLSPRLQGLK